VTAARRNPHAQGVAGLDAQAVDCDVGGAVLGVGPHAEAHGDVGTGVLGGVGGRGDELAQVEVGVGGLVDDLLAVDVLAFLDHDGRDGVLELLAHLEAEELLVHADQLRHAAAAREQADGDLGVGEALDVVEHHGRALLGRARHGSASANVTIDARHLGVRVDLGIGLEQLARLGPQVVQRTAQVVDLRCLNLCFLALCHLVLLCRGPCPRHLSCGAGATVCSRIRLAAAPQPRIRSRTLAVTHPQSHFPRRPSSRRTVRKCCWYRVKRKSENFRRRGRSVRSLPRRVRWRRSCVRSLRHPIRWRRSCVRSLRHSVRSCRGKKGPARRTVFHQN